MIGAGHSCLGPEAPGLGQDPLVVGSDHDARKIPRHRDALVDMLERGLRADAGESFARKPRRRVTRRITPRILRCTKDDSKSGSVFAGLGSNLPERRIWTGRHKFDMPTTRPSETSPNRTYGSAHLWFGRGRATLRSSLRSGLEVYNIRGIVNRSNPA